MPAPTPPPATGFRFAPPPLPASAELDWVLLRAFAPPAARAPEVVSEAAWEEAARLGLAPRIASRSDAALLAAELGEEVAGRFLAARRGAASTALRYEDLAGELAELCRAIGVSLVFLKGIALHLGEHTPPGARPFGDLDCLAGGEDATILWDALVERGFAAGAADANEQHLPPLAAPTWGVIDVHFALRGLWHPPGGWWTGERLFTESQVRALPALPGSWVPKPAMLAAHALAHGLDQHGLAPGQHGLLRMAADLADLLPGEEEWNELAAAAAPWLEPTLSPVEIGAARRLVLALRAGQPPAGAALDEPAGLLLRHLVAAGRGLYGRAQRWRNLRLRLRRARERRQLLRYIRRKLRIPA